MSTNKIKENLAELNKQFFALNGNFFILELTELCRKFREVF